MVCEQSPKRIRADVRVISGSKESLESTDCNNNNATITSSQFSDHSGISGADYTGALLKAVYADHKASAEVLSFEDVLVRMSEIMEEDDYSDQTPQMTSSRPLNVHEPFHLIPKNYSGKSRAIIIGINYAGQYGELEHCHENALNMKDYIMDVHGLAEENITMLIDDGEHEEPSRDNILNAFRNISKNSSAGDTCFVQYSGHSGIRRGASGEGNCNSGTLLPVDFMTAGQISSDDLYETLLCPMKKKVSISCLMDYCRNGTLLNLPYIYRVDEKYDHLSTLLDFSQLKSFSIEKILSKESFNELKIKTKESFNEFDPGKMFHDDDSHLLEKDDHHDPVTVKKENCWTKMWHCLLISDLEVALLCCAGATLFCA